jgi:hypothetical protein
VVNVSDGDTIIILDTKNKQHKIKLSGIDDPENVRHLEQNREMYEMGESIAALWEGGYGLIVSPLRRGIFSLQAVTFNADLP